MNSKETGASEHALTYLIYRHLKENGYKKSASALKQHVSQVQTTNMKVSLEDIFKKWLSEEPEKKTDEGKAPQTGSELTTNAAHNTKPEKKTLAAARQRKRKKSQMDMCISSNVVKDHKTEEDSDSSLDVEKWKRLAFELSDADFAKMDAFINFSTSNAKSTKMRKPAQPKKQQSPKKSKVKTATSLTKTDKKKPTNKKTFSNSESDKTPSNKAVLAECNEKIPESKTDSNLLDQVAMPKTAVSFKNTKKHSLKSPISKTSKKNAEIEKTELKPADTSCNKTKSKKNLPTPGRLETPCKVTDAEIAIQTLQCDLDSVLHSKTGQTKAKKDKSKKDKKAKTMEPVGIDTIIQTEDGTDSLSSDQSKINQVLDIMLAETSSKKSKKSKEPQEPEDVAMPSGECELEVDHNHSNQHQTEALPGSVKKAKTVTETEAVKKRSKKAKKSLTETNGIEKQTKNLEIQVATSILEPLSSETPSKKSKTKKKSKRKRADSSGDNVTSSVTEHVSEGQYNSLIPAGNGAKHQDQECVLAVNEEGTPEPKKRKKHKKDKEKKNNKSDVEEVQPTPLEEERADSLPSSQKKKKKKKQKHKEEEVPSVSTPVPEEYSPKKKKKSSRKNKHAEVTEQELI